MRCLTEDECGAWREAWSRRRQWKRQTTCVTPLDRLPWFTAALVKQLQPFEKALLIVDRAVFDSDPPAIAAVRLAAGERRSMSESPGHLFENDYAGFRAALEAALSEWTDFRVLFSPSRHALLADHDEYTTFFSESAGKIAEVRTVLQKSSVELQVYTAKAP